MREPSKLEIMAAAKFNIQVEEHSSLSLALVYKDASDTVIDISGQTLVMTIYDNDIEDGSATTVTPTLTTDGTDGAFEVAMPWSNVDALGFPQGRYILRINGDAVLYGKFQIKQLRY